MPKKKSKQEKLLSIEVRSLRAEVRKLRKALRPMVEGTFFITNMDVNRAYAALGLTRGIDK